ncbi:hypothetical protein BCR39DRAFT_543659 [Naematelia encephala]|uniref:Mid2 domain-containing protein n=1 Tax=Naematelia encephala TaxID=71784 RepID=A0A1Y2AT57_9TREE|nr:hypothetical protein BCR39DRAFT_543659 [Naematelia encephala]
MRITPSLLVLPLALAHSGPHRRHRARTNLIRAGAAYSNQTIEEIDAASSSAAAYSASLASFSASASPSAATASSVAAVTDSVTSISPTASSAVSSAAPSTDSDWSSVATTSSAAPISSAAPSSTVDDAQTQSWTNAATSPATTSTVASTTLAVVDTSPTTISVSSPLSQSTVVVLGSSVQLVTTISKTASSSVSASAAAAKSSSSSSGLSKPTLIAIIVVCVLVGLAAAGFTAFRRWKLRPSGRFDEKMKPIDFSPYNDGLNDDFLEKTLQRTTSNSSAQMQRQQFVSELEVPGVPEHDFTAGAINAAGHGAYAQDTYHQDPFAHAEQYDYDASYYHQADPHAYPPAAHLNDYPTQDESIIDGYADLQRGNSVGSGSGHGHHTMAYPSENAFPDPSNYLGRPTGGADGPYAQAAQYRGY